MYVFIKILKTCTNSSAKSFGCKYAVQDKLLGIDPDKIGMGNAIRRVLSYYTIRDRFSSIHPDLADIGFSRVEVTEEGFRFIRNTEGTISK